MKPFRNGRTSRGIHVVLLCAALTIGGGVLAEVSLRIYASMNESFGRAYRGFDVLSAKIEPYGEIGFRPKTNSVWRYSNGTVATANRQGFRGPTILIPKPEEILRIVILGGSTTHGWAVNDDETIDAHMRELLKQRYPGLEFDVVNLAFDGYDSYQLVERLRTDGVPLDPNLIVVNSGINDVRNAKFSGLQDPDPRTPLWPGIIGAGRDYQRLGRYTLFTYIKHVSYLARLPAFLRQIIALSQSENDRRKTPPNPAAIEYFGRNMHRIASLVRPRGIPILFSSPPSALAIKFKPHDTSSISYWLADAGTTEEYRLALANRMRDVVMELAREKYPAHYVEHNIPPSMFLDDAHLTSEGNRQMARDFVAAAKPYIIAHLQQNASGNAGLKKSALSIGMW